jgi:ATP-dependent Lon protease
MTTETESPVIETTTESPSPSVAPTVTPQPQQVEIKVITESAKPESKPDPKSEATPAIVKPVVETANDQIAELQKQVNALAIANLLKDYKVPDSLASLVPADLNQAKQFLESDSYKAILDQLNKVTELENQKAELEAKLNATQVPQQVETTPVPVTTTEPAKNVPAKKWEDLGTSDLASIGSLFLNQLL